MALNLMFTCIYHKSLLEPVIASLAQATGMWGLSLTETLVILALILIIVDVFFFSDIATHVAYVLLCVALARSVPVHILFQILIGLAAWFGLVWFHYKIWKGVLESFVNKRLARDRFRPGACGLVREIGEVRDIDGETMVEVKGDLWSFECASEVEAGDRVIVISAKRGILLVSRQPQKD